MSRPTLNVALRSSNGKGANRRLRSEGTIPGVLYGKGKETVSVQADPKAVVDILHGTYGKNTVIDLAVEGESGSRLAIIKDYQVHPWKRRVQHIDLWEISPEQKLTMTVPFRRVNRAEGERMGAKVRITRDDVVVSADANHVPAAIEFDMTALGTTDANVTISKVPMPEGVEAVFKHDYSLVQYTMPRVQAEEKVDPKAAKKGKK
ncbi:MAG: 50S ribosomal protein L25 [Myxococcales bacterium]|nr:50S ribosomal protein L25 [Myxococcales bacterium]MCB9731530.1 50S ribosomal protein L25 [Deltaproteobacteria bacterium]